MTRIDSFYNSSNDDMATVTPISKALLPSCRQWGNSCVCYGSHTLRRNTLFRENDYNRERPKFVTVQLWTKNTNLLRLWRTKYHQISIKMNTHIILVRKLVRQNLFTVLICIILYDGRSGWADTLNCNCTMFTASCTHTGKSYWVSGWLPKAY